MTKEVKQEQGEPYGYFRYDIRLDAWVQSRDNNKGVAFYTKPQPKQEQGEPVCDECGVSGGYALYCLVCAEKFFSKYKEWVSLTDEDMEFLFPHGKSAWLTETLKIFETKLKEKNEA